MFFPLLNSIAVGIQDDVATTVDDWLQFFACQVLESSARHPHLHGVVSVGDSHEQCGLLTLDILLDVHRIAVNQMEPEKAMLHGELVLIVFRESFVPEQCSVDKVELIPCIAVSVTIVAVEHHLA